MWRWSTQRDPSLILPILPFRTIQGAKKVSGDVPDSEEGSLEWPCQNTNPAQMTMSAANAANVNDVRRMVESESCILV